MNIRLLSDRPVLVNRDNPHNYFAWPTVARLRDGRLAMTCSGFRLWHICPFGKSVISFSSDEGETWSLPAILMDTPLDDRDSGVVAFGESGVVVTSFNCGVEDSRRYNDIRDPRQAAVRRYADAYLDLALRDFDCEKYHGSSIRISNNNGTTFGPRIMAPVTAPHGPVPFRNGNLLYVGNRYEPGKVVEQRLAAYELTPEGKFTFLGDIPHIPDGYSNDEPHALVLPSGKILVHIRAQRPDGNQMTIFQSESYDDGKTFTVPHTIGVAKDGGLPPHLLYDNGTIISVYARREYPHQIRAAFSTDDGETWDTDNVIVTLPVEQDEATDHGYPASVVLRDGSILTVYYGKDDAPGNPAFYAAGDAYFEFTGSVIRAARWTYET